MPLNLIERYIFKRALLALVASTFALTAVVWVVKAFQEVDVVTAKGQGVLIYLYMTTLGVPTLAGAVIPIALLIAIIQTINTLNNDSELVVINASGASQGVIIRPFIMLATVTAIVVVYLSLLAGPNSLYLLRQQATQINADLVSVVLREGKFNSIGNGLTFHIKSRAPGGVLQGVFVLDERKENETFTYVARQGAVTKIDGKSFLILRDGQIHRTRADEEKISVIRFSSYAFNLSSFNGNSDVTWNGPEEIPTSELFNPNKQVSYYKRKPNTYVSELHNRLTAGLYPFVFTVIVLVFAGRARSTRQSYGMAIAYAALICIVLRGMSIAAVNSTRVNADFAIVIWLIPLLGFAVPTLILAFNQQITMPKALRAPWEKMQGSFTDTKSNIVQRYARLRRNMTERSS